MKMKNKKLLLKLGASFLAIFLVTGCGNDTDTNDDQETGTEESEETDEETEEEEEEE
ncbi:hypothetical protein LC087_03735 [Bacillus carboniphilus]|uniref:Lipoprotein n=1 Tax=Bacillus carboniphilus TaxID=86663 RepID=A0ABY9JV75_9BACI|nr:hypothetical protein [Bacillus carboniphilus]WLR43311.1 hypothetical protein LC087_03735 [Bacillus carboniphilus]